MIISILIITKPTHNRVGWAQVDNRLGILYIMQIMHPNLLDWSSIEMLPRMSNYIHCFTQM